MVSDRDLYYGYIIKGDLLSAIPYIKQFPENRDLYDRFISVFEQEQYLSYEVEAELNEVLLAYQRYYRDVFYLRIAMEQAESKLKERLVKLLGIPDAQIDLCDLEQTHLFYLFESRGLHFLGGKTSGFYGPYIWRTTEIVSYDVALPDGVEPYSVKLLDSFLMRSWIDYLSFGEIGPGGWTDGDGYINCVKSAWDFESESFRVSLLKHEAQHAQDLKMNENMSSQDLEYRAKLVELIYSTERNLLCAFAQEAGASDPNNGHAMAAHRILQGFADKLGVDAVSPESIPLEQIQTIARELFENSKDKRTPGRAHFCGLEQIRCTGVRETIQ